MLEKILLPIAGELKEVEEDFERRLGSRVPLVTEIAKHLVLSGGKRIRPALMILSARLCGYRGKDYIPLAGAIELIHTATLLHDDVVDNAEMRRGNPTANILWGNVASVLVGDFLLSRAFSMMVEAKDLRVLEVMAETTTLLAEGETFELTKTADLSLSEEEYLEMVAQKTASLMSASARIGAILAKASKEQEEALATFGLNLGIAFQLVDDCLDYIGKEEALGKKVGSDIKEGKVTLPLIWTLGRCSSEEKGFIRDTLLEVDPDLERIRGVVDLVHQYGGISYTFKRAQEFVAEAKLCLSSFPDRPEKSTLMELADYLLSRDS